MRATRIISHRENYTRVALLLALISSRLVYGQSLHHYPQDSGKDQPRTGSGIAWPSGYHLQRRCDVLINGQTRSILSNSWICRNARSYRSCSVCLVTIVSMPQYHLGCLQQGGTRIPESPRSNTTLSITITILLSLIAALTGCQAITDRQDVRPLVLRDVPAQRLAYRFEADIGIPAELQAKKKKKLASIQADFAARRTNDALLRTVASPDGQRALALYGTEDESGPAFRIDLYASDGRFLKNLIPPTLSCVFPETVAWTSDGNFITFIAHKSVKPAPTPTPPIDLSPEPEASPLPSPSVAPTFPAVAAFTTEQIYICNRDGYDCVP